MKMRCGGTTWSVLYSVLMLGTMVRIRLTLTPILFSIPDSHEKGKIPIPLTHEKSAKAVVIAQVPSVIVEKSLLART